MKAGHDSRPTYYVIFTLLLVLTATTVGVSFLKLNAWSVPVALSIAAVKATLVLLFFMHLLESPRLIWIVASAALVWLAILFALTISDYASRTWLRT